MSKILMDRTCFIGKFGSMKATSTLFTNNLNTLPISCYGRNTFPFHLKIFKVYYFKHAVVTTAAYFNILAYLLKAKTVEPKKQPLLANGSEITFVSRQLPKNRQRNDVRC
jgi:hypothetical protein